MYDLLIEDTQIVDGAGNPWRFGNVAVKGERIVAVGNTPSDDAAITLDGRGLVTCPGFIDFHAHSDITFRAKHDVENGGWTNWFSIRWDDTLLTRVSTTKNQRYVGQTIAEIAAQREEEPIDTVFNLLLEENVQFHMAPITKCWDDIDYVVKHPLCKIASDGTALAPYGPLAGCKHPRCYGTFPRALGRLVRERSVLRLEEAVRKMTSAPAARLGLTDRGLLQAGLAADICVFDPKTVIDRAAWDNLEAYPEGIETVIINGQVVIRDGEHTGTLPGRVLVP